MRTAGHWFYDRYVGRHLPRGREHACLEVGVVPGRHLLDIGGAYGYRVTGVDFSPRVHDLAPIFAGQGVEATFVQTDFLTWDPPERFDVVTSYGFIEHFQNFQLVVERHWRLVKPGGHLLLVIPSSTPLQWALRRLVCTRERIEQALHSHNQEINRLPALRRAVSRCPGSQILVARYVREMTIWLTADEDGMRPRAGLVLRALRPLERAARRFGVSSRWFSPEALVLARKETPASGVPA
jgi:SAM-dependent methyltransferase